MKKRITSDIVETILQRGGKFLKEDDDRNSNNNKNDDGNTSNRGWIEVDIETAKLKVSHVFRNIRLQEKRKEEKKKKSQTKKERKERIPERKKVM